MTGDEQVRLMTKKQETGGANNAQSPDGCSKSQASETPKMKLAAEEAAELVQSLTSQIEEQRMLRMEDAKKVEAKAAKIKLWVTTKLKELEEQNVQLREQNSQCNVQLEALRGRLAQISTLPNGTKEDGLENDCLRGNMGLFRPCSGSHESLPDRVRGDERRVPSRPSTLGRDSRSKCRSPNRLRRTSSSDASSRCNGLRHSRVGSCGEVCRKPPSMAKSDSQSSEGGTSSTPGVPLDALLDSLTKTTGSLPRHLPSTLPSRKPQPQPRLKTSQTNSLFTKSVDCIDFHDRCRSLDPIANGKTSRAKDELHDYSEIYTPNTELPPWGEGPPFERPPTPPLHRFPSWESRIYQVAQKGLSMSDLGTDEGQRESTWLGSYPEIHVPVYAAVKGRASQIRSVPFSGDSSDSSDGEEAGGGSSEGGFLYPRSSLNPSSSNESSASSPSKSKTSSISPANLSAPWSPSKAVKRDMSFESGMSDDYAIPPDARSDTISVLSTPAPTVSARTSCNEITTNTFTNASPQIPPCFGLTSPRFESSLEKSGYLTKLGGKLKTWKKRYFILKDGAMSFWKSQNDVDRPPVGEILLEHGSVVHRSEGAHTFELSTGKKVYYFTADNTLLVEEWVRVIQNVLRRNATRLLLSRDDAKPTLQGWLNKVKNGHAKRCWCVLLGKVFIYFKSPADKNPMGQINMRDTRVEEIDKMSDSEGEEQEMDELHREELTIGLFPAHQGPTYLICPSKPEKDSWIYHLTVVSGGGGNVGTQYEQLVQKLMELDGDANCVLWHHPLLLHTKEPVNSPFTTLPSQQLQSEAIKLFKSCQLYTSALMEPSAIDYHVILCQNALHLCLSHPELQQELFCGIVKQTSAHLHTKASAQVAKTLNKIKHSRNFLLCATQSLFLCDSSGAQKASPTLNGSQTVSIDPKINPAPFTFVQGWQFLALAVSLFVPKNNKLLWYLKRHIARYSDNKTETGKYAIYCSRALQRTMDNGGREAKPSRMEVLSILLKNPYHHSLPHAIPVHFLNGTYQVVGFDGSTCVEEFLSALNAEVGGRDVHQSGFALFSDDPIEPDLEHCLNHNAKLCDVISKWETALREKGSGKFENTKVIRLLYKNRLYWKYAIKYETEKEKLLLCYQVNEQIQQGKFPVTKELALELTTLMAQIDMSEANTERSRGSGSGGPSATHVETAFAKFYPQRYKEELKDNDKRAILDAILEKWIGLRGRSQSECVRIFLTCARKWPFFGATLFPAVTTGRGAPTPESPCPPAPRDRRTPVWVAVNEEAVSLLDKATMLPVAIYLYGNVVTFGGCQEDFMLVVNGPVEGGRVGTQKLILSMGKPKILELTLLIADYMNALGRGVPGTPQTGTLTRNFSVRSGRVPGGSGGQPDLLQMTADADVKDSRKRLNTESSIG